MSVGSWAREATYCFDRFTLDLCRSTLMTADGSEIPLRPKSFALLRHLIENPGRLITRDELMHVLWPGTFVTDESVAQCIRDVRRALGNDGERWLRTLPRRGYLFTALVSRANPVPAVLPACEPRRKVPPPDRPMLAVLPFVNMTGDPNQECLSDGITEEVALALSYLRWFAVVSLYSTFTYKDCRVDVRQVGRELGAGYVLEGSVRQAGGRVRITVRLCETEAGRQVWGGRFNGALTDIFDLQDHVAEAVAGTLEGRLRLAEAARTRATPAESLGAYDLYLRVLPQHYVTQAGNNEALDLLHRGMALDPNLIVTKGALVGVLTMRFAHGWSDKHDVAEALRCAREVVDSGGEDDAAGLGWAGLALAYLGQDCNAGLAAADRAVRLAPHSVQALFHAGWLRVCVGDTQAAVARLEKAIRLNPLDPTMFYMTTSLGVAHFNAGRYEAAAELARRGVQGCATYLPAHRLLATSLAHLGAHEAARSAADELHTRVAPGYTVTAAIDHCALHESGLRQRYFDGLRLAGLPK
jgi:TolB-like protein